MGRSCRARPSAPPRQTSTPAARHATQLRRALFVPRGGWCAAWIVGPGVLGVAPAQVGAHAWVAVVPEGLQVCGDGGRASRRGEQVQQERNPAASEDRRCGPAEDLLQSHGEHRLILGVVDPHARPAGDLDALRGEVIESARLRPRHHRSQGGRHVDTTKILGRADPRQLRPEPGVEVLCQCCVAHVGPRVSERAVQEVEASAQRRGRVRPVEQCDPLARDGLPDRVAHGLPGWVAERGRAELDCAQQRPSACQHPPTGPGDLVHLGPQRSRCLQREVFGERGRRADPGLALPGLSLCVTDREPLQSGQRPRGARVERCACPGRHQVARRIGALACYPVWMRQGHQQTHRHVIGECSGVARRPSRVAGGALRRHDLLQPGDLVAPGSCALVSAQRPGAQRPGLLRGFERRRSAWRLPLRPAWPRRDQLHR